MALPMRSSSTFPKSRRPVLSPLAIRRVGEEKGDHKVVDLYRIQMIVRPSKSLVETELIDGVILDERVLLPTPPRIAGVKSPPRLFES